MAALTLTTDPNDPRLGHGVDTEPRAQQDAYLVDGSQEPFIRPVRTSYKHLTCGAVTTMAVAIAETYARKPWFYGATYCTRCRMHLPVGENGEFVWLDDGTKVGT